MTLLQIMPRPFWTAVLAASTLLVSPAVVAHPANTFDSAYQLDSDFFAEQGFELQSNNTPLPLKRSAEGVWSIDTETSYVLSDTSKAHGLRPTSATDAAHKFVQRRLGELYEQHAYQQGFDEAINFMRAMHAQGVGLELIFNREYERGNDNLMMEAYWLNLSLVDSENGSVSRISIPLHLPKVPHINPRSALSLSQVSDAPSQSSL